MELENEQQLYQKIEESYRLLEKTKKTEEKIVLMSYISGLFESISNITGQKIMPRMDKLFKNTQELKKYYRKIELYGDKWNRDFTIHKNFHYKYTSQLMIHTENFLIEAKKEKLNKPTIQELEFDKEEFYEILFHFMKTLNLEEFCKNKIDNKNMHFVKEIKKPQARAYTIYNPITKQSDIFIKNFHYDIFTMIRLVHELGHAYYFEKTGFNSKEYLQYTNSYYKETISKLFEKLYLEYMINNNIKKDASKMQVLDNLENNLAFLSYSFSYSLLDDEFLWGFREDEKYKIKQVKRLTQFIQNKELIKKIVYDFDKLEVKDNYIYTYGDIISMFLKEDFFKEGLNSEKIEDYFTFSKKKFYPKYLLKNNMTPNHYLELYQEELKLLKK